VVACRPWLIAEIEAVRPQLVVCLGATAAQSLLGTAFRISTGRGQLLRLPDAAGVRSRARVLATVHPSAVLRDRTDRREAYRGFVDDLRLAGAAVTGESRAVV
jgi:DNA polymerase